MITKNMVINFLNNNDIVIRVKMYGDTPKMVLSKGSSYIPLDLESERRIADQVAALMRAFGYDT